MVFGTVLFQLLSPHGLQSVVIQQKGWHLQTASHLQLVGSWLLPLVVYWNPCLTGSAVRRSHTNFVRRLTDPFVGDSQVRVRLGPHVVHITVISKL